MGLGGISLCCQGINVVPKTGEGFFACFGRPRSSASYISGDVIHAMKLKIYGFNVKHDQNGVAIDVLESRPRHGGKKATGGRFRSVRTVAGIARAGLNEYAKNFFGETFVFFVFCRPGPPA